MSDCPTRLRAEHLDNPLGVGEPRPRLSWHLPGSAGWGDAIVLVPWELFHEYGDDALLAEMWPQMVAWLDRTERMAATGRHPDRIARRPEPAEHETYLWDSGFHWGEWLEPGAEPTDFPAFIAADKADVATAFFAWSTRHAAAVARTLAKDKDAERYETLSARVADAWRFQVRPCPGGGLSWARTSHITPHGMAAVAWERTGDALDVEVTVPPGCIAEVILPDGTTHEAAPGVSTYRFVGSVAP